MKGAIKINWRKKIRSIQGSGFDQGLLWVQLGAEELSGCKLGLPNKGDTLMALKRVFKRRENLCELGACMLYLIKSDMWGQLTNTKPIQIAPLPPLFLPLTLGPHRDRRHNSFFPAPVAPWLTRVLR
jgi:hypothetical protein